MSTQSKTIPCKGYLNISHNYRDPERHRQVAQFIIDRGVSTSGPVRRELEVIAERRGNMCFAEPIIREFEHQCP